MQFSTTAIASLLAGLAAAAPTTAPRSGAKSMMAADTAEWTIEGMQRVCNTADTQCNWTFTIDTNVDGVTPTPCTFTVNSTGSTPASQAPGTGATCGAFTVTSGWSGQFGPGNGFTTLSVVDYVSKLIVWPAYTDVQLAGGVVVTPDQSYAPQTLP